MARKSKTDWIEQGFKFLIDYDINQMSVEKMGNLLSVSRGSFYHHFDNINHFQESLLQAWYQRYTVEILHKNKDLASSEQLVNLRDFAWSLRNDLDVAIRAWSLHDPLAKKYQEKVDSDRLKYLTQIYISTYGKNSDKAKIRIAAQIAYCTFIGTQSIQPELSPAQLKKLKTGLHHLLAETLE